MIAYELFYGHSMMIVDDCWFEQYIQHNNKYSSILTIIFGFPTGSENEIDNLINIWSDDVLQCIY